MEIISKSIDAAQENEQEVIIAYLKEEDGDRHCALCFKDIPSSCIKTCSKCNRRAYCSRECQVTDWKREGFQGQGHKSWCSLLCGEEDIDWKIVPIEGKGLGVVAKRLIPPNYRIMVVGFTNKDSFSRGLITTDGRCKMLNHACDSNADRVVDKQFETSVVYSKREIQPGEEITATYVYYNESYGYTDEEYVAGTKILKSFADCRTILESRWNIVCPPNCFCRDPIMDALIIQTKNNYAKMLIHNIMKNPNYSYTKKAAGKDRPIMQSLLENHEKIRSTSVEKANLLEMAFGVETQFKGTLAVPKAQEYIRESYEINRNIFHPKCKKVLDLQQSVQMFSV